MTMIGNKLKLAFELVPVTPSWERRYAPERTAWAGTAIWVNGKNLCSHIASGSLYIEDYFYVPLGPLTDWLVRVFPSIEFQERAPLFPTSRDLHQSVERWFNAHPPRGLTEDDWLDAREDWWTNHFLRAGADGARLPNLAFVRDDEELVLDWDPPHFFGDDAPTMRWPEGQFSLPWDEGRAVLEEFASIVARWFRESDASGTYAWAQYESPFRHAGPDISQALELFTGRSVSGLEEIFGIDELDGLLQKLHLDESCRDPAASPHCQVLRDLSPIVSEDVGSVLVALGSAAARGNPVALGRWRIARQIANDASRPAGSPEQAGYLAAPEIREALGLNGQPIDDVPMTLSQLGLSYGHTEVAGGYDQMMVAARYDGAPVATTLQTSRTAKPWGQRFEACRALGHVLLDPIREGAVGAASGPFATASRRRRSGAFAAELLLPETAIASLSGHAVDGAAEGPVFEQLLHEYGIGASAAAYHLWNRGWLSSSEVRDELIERYASASPG